MYQSFNPSQLMATPFLFFTGKGGVGKTSTACSTAIHLADSGKKVLLLSTDPASNLQDVLEVELTNAPQGGGWSLRALGIFYSRDYPSFRLIDETMLYDRMISN